MHLFRLLLAAILAILCIPLLVVGSLCWFGLGVLVTVAEDLARERHGDL